MKAAGKKARGTPTTATEPAALRCSFCGRSQEEVGKLITKSPAISICDACVGICCAILLTDFADNDATGVSFITQCVRAIEGRLPPRSMIESPTAKPEKETNL